MAGNLSAEPAGKVQIRCEATETRTEQSKDKDRYWDYYCKGASRTQKLNYTLQCYNEAIVIRER